MPISRRTLLASAAALAAASCAQGPQADDRSPIIFVHGNGDSAALWLTTIWRFESNGWPRDRLHTVDLPYPLARDADDKPQAGRSGSADQRAALAAEVDRVLAATGAQQVVLMANSRGGYAVRSFVRAGGAAKVSHAILGGTPNHGVRHDPTSGTASEFNGAGPFLQALNNQGAPGVETTPGPRWMTVRSDANDKFAQPEGTWIGMPGKPTGITVASPELRGAHNVVIAGIDHRETSFGPAAFAAAWRFITGRDPVTTGFTPETSVVLDGLVSGQGLDNDPAKGGFATNLPLQGATVEVYEVDPASAERRGDARWRKTVGADGRWGPFNADGRAWYEFVVAAPGYGTLHIYRQPFPRSSAVVNLRADRLPDADRGAGAVLSFIRPRGYFGLPRDRVTFDGQDPAPGIPRGVAGVAVSRLKLPAGPQRAVVGTFNDQRIAGRSWPAADHHLVQIELH